MKVTGTTIRIRAEDKAKLDELCQITRRGIVHMIGLLIDREYTAQTAQPTARRTKLRKAG